MRKKASRETITSVSSELQTQSGIILMAIDTLIEGGDTLTAEQQKTVKDMILDSALRLNEEVNALIRRAKGIPRD